MNQSSCVVYFEVATIYARKIELEKRPIRLTSRHRGQMAKAKNGYVIIEKRWFKRN